MFYELIQHRESETRFLVMALDHSEMSRRAKVDYAAYIHLNLQTLELPEYEKKSLIVSTSDSSGAHNQVEGFQRAIMRQHPGWMVYGICIHAKIAEQIREKGLIYEEWCTPLNFTLVLMCGQPQRATAYIQERFGLKETDLPEGGLGDGQPTIGAEGPPDSGGSSQL